MIKLHRALIAGALFALVSVPAQADSVMGTLGMVSADVTTNNGSLNLTTVTTLTSNNTSVLDGTQVHDFAAPTLVPGGTSFGTNVVNLADLSAFSFSNTDYGMFQASSGTVVGPTTSNFLTIYFVGTYSPGSLNSSDFTSGAASATVTFNSLGGRIIETILVTAPPAVPEPASFALAGIGLAGIGLVRVLRKRSV